MVDLAIVAAAFASFGGLVCSTTARATRLSRSATYLNLHIAGMLFARVGCNSSRCNHDAYLPELRERSRLAARNISGGGDLS